MSVGILLVVGGIFGFLPILGFWMIPLGLLVIFVRGALGARCLAASAWAAEKQWLVERGPGRVMQCHHCRIPIRGNSVYP
ncbi:MAG: hypothetical protein OEM59_14165 [Rhodospirillales bacterium]|nr:hypothetical protein [Rhodospirillales bacterium]